MISSQAGKDDAMSTRKTSVEMTIKDTIKEAPREVLRAEARREVEALTTMDGLDLADPEVMAQAWRP
jgi:hypothetical protein